MTAADNDRLARATVAIRLGHTDVLRQLLAEERALATAWVHRDAGSRSLLHVATDWPGHFPSVAETIAVLVAAGAEVNARVDGPHPETPLHWAASSNDLAALDALLDHGAAIDAPGGVIGGGTPLGDATAFGQWAAAQALVERGAHASLFDLAALGRTDDVLAQLSATGPEGPAGDKEVLDEAFWAACHGGRLETARALQSLGADVNWVPGWERTTPLEAAAREGAADLVSWLHTVGAVTCAELPA